MSCRTIEACADYVRSLDEACDLLLMPLSLDNAMSLHIAEEVVRQNARLRTVLFTASPIAPFLPPSPPFDFVVALKNENWLELRSELNKALHGAAEGVPRPSWSREELGDAILGTLQREPVFGEGISPLPGIEHDLETVAAMTGLGELYTWKGESYPPWWKPHSTKKWTLAHYRAGIDPHKPRGGQGEAAAVPASKNARPSRVPMPLLRAFWADR